jgi:hypothetical protein
MFEFLIYPPSFNNESQVNAANNIPIHVAAQGMMSLAMGATVQQFNDACERVCYDKKTKVSSPSKEA